MVGARGPEIKWVPDVPWPCLWPCAKLLTMRTTYTKWRLLLLAAFLLGTFSLMAWFILARLQGGRESARREEPKQSAPGEKQPSGADAH